MQSYLGKLFVALVLSIGGAICINTSFYFNLIVAIKEHILSNNYLVDASGFVLSTVIIIIATDIVWLLICWIEKYIPKKQSLNGFQKSEIHEIINNELKKL
ncbi:hypothetical protein I6L81_06025 [Providencia rettgeri]|uniref:hypothetical protein n=1 Tax=Providencia rettgeri TaxID=587 RepID=UPI001C21A3A3|nr:hypothetical protein [Providencia rettgeri]QXB92515.1 hypothetical protein I6L81_06025 [Providencia rettgeri]